MDEQATGRRRLPRHQRERLIIEEAIRFFAEVGFEGQTRALAERLGVTQPLLYRYFPDKDALIERVYQEVFVGVWEEGWTSLLRDRSIPLARRISEFYRLYHNITFSYERIRLSLFAGLRNSEISRRYLAFIRDNLLAPLCIELRAEAGVQRDDPPTPQELEAVAGLHGAVGYLGLRRWVYKSEVPDDIDAAIDRHVRTFIGGALDVFRELAKA